MKEKNYPADISPFLEAARSIGYQLARTALWQGNRCNWLGSSVEPVKGAYTLVERTFGNELYSGMAGIALFLSLLLEQQPDEIIQETLEGTINQLLADETPEGGSHWGYYGGALGIAATLIETGEKQKRKDWTAKGWEKLLHICRQPLQDMEMDIISGAAGAIPVLLKLYHRSGNKTLYEAAVNCGNFLMGKAIRTSACWSWPFTGTQCGVTGYSHGTAGIATSLLELYRATSDTACYTAAMMGYHFERMHYNPQVQNWPDFRDFGQATTNPAAQPIYAEAWCHGAPGIALSRLRAWQITNDPAFRQEAEIALATTHRSIYNILTNPAAPSNFSICHGLAGNADILLEGGAVLSNALFTEVANQVGNYGLEKYYRNGIAWPSGVNDPTGLTPGMSETPGLMLGLAGTGYFYLRLAAPAQVSSLLLV